MTKIYFENFILYEWCFITGDPLDRLKAVGIELVDESGNQVLSLI